LKVLLNANLDRELLVGLAAILDFKRLRFALLQS
jgi:hypothetical protein